MPRSTHDRHKGELVDVLGDLSLPTPFDPPADPVPDVDPVPPAPDSSLTPEQRRIRELENQLAVERGGKDPAESFAFAEGEDTILIHFVEDGLTALGRVWFRGQEIEFERDGRAYQDTCDRFGRSWLALDESAQIDRFGKVMFRKGPWPGKTYQAAAAEQFSGARPSEDELQAADQAEARRRRAAPLLPTT